MPFTANHPVRATGDSQLESRTPANFRADIGLGTIATQAADGVDIDGGAIDGTTIGATTPAAATVTTLVVEGNITLDAINVILDTTTGTKIGTAATQKLGFFDATPIVQPASANQAVVTMGNQDAEISALTFSNPPAQAECEALRDKCEELADDVRNAVTLLHELRTALVNLGLIKGAA